MCRIYIILSDDLLVAGHNQACWLVHAYDMHPNCERGNYSENCVYYDKFFSGLSITG